MTAGWWRPPAPPDTTRAGRSRISRIGSARWPRSAGRDSVCIRPTRRCSDFARRCRRRSGDCGRRAPGPSSAARPNPEPPPTRLRLAVHTDVPYHRSDDGIYGEHAFTLFLIELASRLEYLVAFGRLDPGGGRGRYPLGSAVDFEPLPHYESLVHLRQVLRAALASMVRFWRLLGRV